MTRATQPATLAEHAAMYAHRGTKIFPLWWTDAGVCACNDARQCSSPGKHPRTGRGGLHNATNDPHQIDLWWALWPNANIGLPAGANGLAIIDVDPYHDGDDSLSTLCTWALSRGVDLMATRTVRTGSGGLHLYYRQPLGGIKSTARAFRRAPGLDTRGRDGYVVAPPSMHASGNPYELVDNGHGLARWPAILTPLMERAATPPPAPRAAGTPAASGDRGARWAQAALAGECDQLRAMTTEGSGRNGALNVAAYKLGRRIAAGMLDEAEAAAALYDAASGWHGHGERELRRTIASGLRAGMANPHGGPTTGEARA